MWREAKSDYARACVLTNQRAEHCDGVREEIKLWVLTNFDVWRRDRPDFFTDKLVKRIPPDMLPERFREQAAEQGSDRRRRSSFGLKTVTVGALLRTDASAASSGPDAPSKLMASSRMSKLITSPKSARKGKIKTEDGLQMQPRSVRQKQSPKLKTLLKTFNEAEQPFSAKLDLPRTARQASAPSNPSAKAGKALYMAERMAKLAERDQQKEQGQSGKPEAVFKEDLATNWITHTS